MEPRTIHIPPRLGLDSVERLRRELNEANLDAEVGVLVLRGSQEVFCNGLDTDELLLGADHAARARAIEGFQAVLAGIRLGPKPTLAVVAGSALGGGVGLVAACDLALGSTAASFAFPEALFGLIPAMVLPLALERMRPQVARLWALTASRRSAEEALSAGLLDQVVEPARLERAVTRWVRQLSRVRPEGVRQLMTFSARASRLSIEEALAEGGRITLEASGDDAVRSALSSFREHGVFSWED